MERIDADLLIPGRGEPLRDATVLVEDGRITFAGARTELPDGSPEAGTILPVIMPGMWECHGHLIGMTDANLDAAMFLSIPHRVARATKDAERALQAGITSIREAGGFGLDLARAIDEGSVVGPTIYGAGSILSTTGGHGDMHGLPLEWVHDATRRGEFLHVCDGVPEVLRAVRSQLRRNARVIKICASGGVMSEVDHPIHQQFSGDELAAIVDEAGRAERVVMAHCHGKPGIMAALEAGVKTIEHGTYLDEEAAAAMREADALLVPTRLIVDRLVTYGKRSNIPDYALRKLEITAEHHAGALSLAHESGVRIAMGTDIFASTLEMPVAWGQNGQELELMVACGLSPLEAIEAATANGPDTLGPQAPQSGQLAEGFDADIIAVASDPLDDVAVLGEPRNVTHVWKHGALVKPPAAA